MTSWIPNNNLANLTGAEENRKAADLYYEVARAIFCHGYRKKEDMEIVQSVLPLPGNAYHRNQLLARLGLPIPPLSNNKLDPILHDAFFYFHSALSAWSDHEATLFYYCLLCYCNDEDKRAAKELQDHIPKIQNEDLRTRARINLMAAYDCLDQIQQALKEAKKNLSPLFGYLSGAFNVFVYSALCNDEETMKLAGATLMQFSWKQADSFLRLRKCFHEKQHCKFWQRYHKDPKFAQTAELFCPPLFKDAFMWQQSLQGAFALYWPRAEKEILRFSNKLMFNEREEWRQSCAVQLYIDLLNQRFDPTKGSFESWLYSWLRFRLKDWRRQQARKRRFSPIEPWTNFPQAYFDSLALDQKEALDRFCLSIPWSKGRELLIESLLEEKPHQDMANQHQMSEQEITNWIRRVRYYLKNKGLDNVLRQLT